jgi:hypothetical protein
LERLAVERENLRVREGTVLLEIRELEANNERREEELR